MDSSARRKVVFFLVLTVVLCLPFYGLILSAGTLAAGGGLATLGLMWCPGVAALLTRLILQRNLRGIGWGWGRWRYPLAAYFLTAAAGLVVYGLVWATGLGGFSAEALTGRLAAGLGRDALSLPLALLFVATVGFAESMVSATGEELGWRGLLVPELARGGMSYGRLALLSGGVWALYHYPLLLFADYKSAAPTWFALLCFTVTVLAASFIFAWLRLRSGSVWPAVILHACHNLFVQGVFDPLTVDRGWTPYLTTEFGAGLAVVYSLIALWCWKRRHRLP